MKPRSRIEIAVLTLVLCVAAGARASLYVIPSGTLNAAIPDGNVTGYQSTLSITSFTHGPNDTSEITDVNVKLNISGGYNGDLFGYLVGPNGGFAVLLNRLGRTATDAFGYGTPGLNVTLDGQASGHSLTDDIHRYNELGNNPIFSVGRLTGTWKEDGRSADPDAVTDASTRDALLNSFNTKSASGDWTLFLADLSFGDQSTLVSWEIDLSTVPEPASGALAIFGGIVGLIVFVRRIRRSVLIPTVASAPTAATRRSVHSTCPSAYSRQRRWAGR